MPVFSLAYLQIKEFLPEAELRKSARSLLLSDGHFNIVLIKLSHELHKTG